MLAANATVKWTPDFYSKRMDDWLRNMGDWNISRKRYFGLPLPFYPCACGELNVVGSSGELLERATRGADELQELHRPVGRRRRDLAATPAARRSSASPRSATRGSTPASSRSRRSAGRTRSRSSTATRTAPRPGSRAPTSPTTRTGRRGSRPTGSRRCASRSASGSTRSSSCRSTLVGRAPYKQILAYEKLRDETGQEMHKSWGNAIEAGEAMEQDGRGRDAVHVRDHVPSRT